jgi:hypothetical protein
MVIEVVVEGTVVVVVVIESLKQNSPFSKVTFSKAGPGVHPPPPSSRQLTILTFSNVMSSQTPREGSGADGETSYLRISMGPVPDSIKSPPILA